MCSASPGRVLLRWRFLAAILALVSLLCRPSPSAAATTEGTLARPEKVYDNDTRIDSNQLDMFVTNSGSFASDISMGTAGLHYPSGTSRTAMFAAGLWLGAQVGGQSRVTVAEYSREFTPGRILSPSQWDNPYNPAHRVYKISPGDTPQSNPDYAEWPAAYGAPVDGNGNPRQIGTQTLWSVFHDLDPAAHTNNAGSSDPLGVEVRHTTFAFNWFGSAESAIFLEWKILNKGANNLENMYVAIWSDPDLGGATDDLVGCDPASSLAYCYNADNNDEMYGASPPAVGVKLLQGPIIPSPGDTAYVSGRMIPNYRNLPMSAYTKYFNGIDPRTRWESYNYMQGLLPDGAPIIDPTSGEETRYMVAGDPVAGTGWLDGNAADKRMMLSSGPFTLAPGDSQVVAAAVIIGQGNNRLTSISVLRQRAEQLPALFRAAMGEGESACCLSDGSCVLSSAADCLIGQFFPGTVCGADPCSAPFGACCFDDGTCLILAPDDCAGRYQGDGSVCVPGLCPEYGSESACCLGSGVCQILREYDCLQRGGTYILGEICDLLPPGEPVGWQHNNTGHPMIDEIAGPGGSPVFPDGHGGPGVAVWHSNNSTGDWRITAGGGNGSEGRFTREGADLPNLTEGDLILRWDHHSDNVGLWALDNAEAGPIPFGLYERNSVTGEETRLLPVLFSGGYTPGSFDISSSTPDPSSGFPATDWIYAFRFDPQIMTWEEIVQDAMDGTMENDPTTAELFARMIFASALQALPADGTVIQFTTTKSGILAGSGFDGAVPLSWPPPRDGASCIEIPQYEVYRDSTLIATTERTDFLDTEVNAGELHSYSIRTRNPHNGETSDFSSRAIADVADGDSIYSAFSILAPQIDGIIHSEEWLGATVIDATFPRFGPACRIWLKNDAESLYVSLEDAVSADDFRIYVDTNGNGVFDPDTLDEGMVSLDHGVVRFSRLRGVYPDVAVVDEIESPSWMRGAAGRQEAEVALSLDAGVLAHRPHPLATRLFFHSALGAAVFPKGPAAVVAQSPRLFAGVRLADAPTPVIPAFSPSAQFLPDGTLRVSVGLPVDFAVSSVLCLTRPAVDAAPDLHGEAGDYTERPMMRSGERIFVATIPSGEVGVQGLLCKVRVIDVTGDLVESNEIRIKNSLVDFAPPLVCPNPARSGVTVAYGIRVPQRVTAAIFNVNGEAIRRLMENTRVEAGLQTLIWDGIDFSGKPAPNGVYYIRIRGETFRFERTVTMLR